jgi:16S rRNA (cytidine1402-2'-O)-methyltransferase
MAILYVVATPIGNLGDLSPRAIEILRAVDVIACEDTRHTIRLLNHFGIQRSLTSYHEFNEEKKAIQLADRLASGENVALVSDAGTPGISDPGYRLVRECRQRNIPVIAVAGPSALTAALSVAGLPSNEFVFLGFLPSKKGARRQKLMDLRHTARTLVFYEAPHRIEETLEDMLDIFGDREVCALREITKIHEDSVLGRLSEVRKNVKPVGEFVLVVAGGTETPPAPPSTREEVLKTLGMTRNELYDLFFKKQH